MNNQVNTLKSIKHDLTQINKELNQMHELWDAIKVLESDDPETTDLFNMTIYGAAQILAEASDADLPGLTLKELYHCVDGRIEFLLDEKKSFEKIREQLLTLNCENLINWIKQEVADLESRVSKSVDRLSESPTQVRLRTLKDVLKRFNGDHNV